MNVNTYLQRIGFKKEIAIDETTLIELHRCHVMSIPFECLDIHLKIPIQLDLDSLHRKIILNKRGGFCYELNYLFYSLLKDIGFECKIVSSRIYQNDEILGPEFDHMSLIVTLNDKWLIDVGYGGLFIEPIKVVDNLTTKGRDKHYQIQEINADLYLLKESKNGVDFTNRYEFDMTPRNVTEFEHICKFKQQSKESHFVKNRICTLPTVHGRTTIFNTKLIKRELDVRKESEIQSTNQLNQILYHDFGIKLKDEIIQL